MFWIAVDMVGSIYNWYIVINNTAKNDLLYKFLSFMLMIV